MILFKLETHCLRQYPIRLRARAPFIPQDMMKPRALSDTDALMP